MEGKNINIKTKIGITTIVLVMILMASLFSGYIIGYNTGIQTSFNQIKEILETQYGINIEIADNGNGQYVFTLIFPDRTLTVGVELHLTANHYIPHEDINHDGVISFPEEYLLLSSSYHVMSLTTFGKNWIADNLAKVGGDNVTKFATYIGCSNDSSSFNAAWEALPNEITANGLGRANGSFTDTGVGTWNITNTFSVSGTDATKLYGYYMESYANWDDGGLVAAEQQGVGNQKNLNSGDTLQVTIQGTIS